MLGCILIFAISGCVQSPQRRPNSEKDIGALLKKYGNFFEPIKIKNSVDLKRELPIAKKLGIKSKIVKNVLDLPEFDIDTIIEIGPWIIEKPVFSGAYGQPSTDLVTYVLEPSFESLTDMQFDALKKHFKSDVSLKYDKSKKYSLIHFLPPVVQALYGNYYVSNRFTHTKKEFPWAVELMDTVTITQISRVTNCWNAAWEYQRNSKANVTVFFSDEASVKEVFESETYSKEILRADAKAISELYSKPEVLFSKLQPGDLIMIYQTFTGQGGEYEVLAHVNTVIDTNIVFEKTNAGSSFPYRLSFLTDSLDNLIVMDKADENMPTTAADLQKLRMVVRRFSKPLPHVGSLINMRLKPGIFLDVTTLPAKKQPPLDFQNKHNVVSELGTGGTIINENMYKIEDQQIQLGSEGLYTIIPSVQDL